LDGNFIWFIESDSESPKGYFLVSVFRVAGTGDTGDTPLEHFASGPGYLFPERVRLNDLEWFRELFRKTAHFSLGVPEVTDQAIIAGLCELGRQGGFVAS
jgi:hypothetical protein